MRRTRGAVVGGSEPGGAVQVGCEKVAAGTSHSPKLTRGMAAAMALTAARSAGRVAAYSTAASWVPQSSDRSLSIVDAESAGAIC